MRSNPVPNRSIPTNPDSGLSTVYNALDAKNLSEDFAEAYAARPLRAERKAYEAEQREKQRGNVESPFGGIEDGERKPRSAEEMQKEAERLCSLFPEVNRRRQDEE